MLQSQVTDLTSKICLDDRIGARMISPPFARCRVLRNSAGADKYGSTCIVHSMFLYHFKHKTFACF